ncbi:MAG: hydrogenase [Gammaproteobacteria bacterium]|nr:hydrogenase [Gammaproteobacteria bacterium]
MILLAASTVLFMSGALGSILFQRAALKKIWALGSVLAGSLLGLIPAFQVLRNKITFAYSFKETLPGLKFQFGCDELSAFFLIPLLGLSAGIALYAFGYLKKEKHLLGSLACFPLLVAAMMGVLVAQDGFSFLIVWEIMSLTSFFLVTTEHGNREVRFSGWIYLVTTHCATLFLLVFFILLFKKTGSFAFQDFTLLSSKSYLTGFLFLAALIGFGTKAGIFPFHIWLPHAHPAAPSYISALMSGIMIKTGIYGILRAVTFLPPLPLWCIESLLVLGILSTVLGVLYALLQHDLKRLLAYHSIENIGIIIIGIGLGLLGRHTHNAAIEFLGFAGALFHILNHTIFKGLLFLGAGNIIQATHERRIDQLGGLLKFMPLTGITFIIASLAICGLPPFNGFISEWLIYMGLFDGVKDLPRGPFSFCIASLVGIAFAGGLAIACFTKVIGVVFLGLPRTKRELPLQEGSWLKRLPMIILAILCFVLGVMPQLVLPFILPTLPVLGLKVPASALNLPIQSLQTFSVTFMILIGIFILIALIYKALLLNKTKRLAPTWDCGLREPSARMQYTASSYAEPLSTFFYFLTGPTVHFQTLKGIFPKTTSFKTHVEDLAERNLWTPFVQKTVEIMSWVRKQQQNQIQNYLAYIFVTLILLLLWEVWVGI